MLISNQLVRGHKTIGSHLNQTNPTNSQQFLVRFSLQGRRFAGSRKTGGAEIHQIWQNTKIGLQDVCARKGMSGSILSTSTAPHHHPPLSPSPLTHTLTHILLRIKYVKFVK